ncbi:MAG: sigma-70 factor domain-containing protein, partial [Actinomycetota bacterium]
MAVGDVCILPTISARGASRDTAERRRERQRYDVAKDRIDRDEEDLVRLYLTDIGQYTLLTKED